MISKLRKCKKSFLTLSFSPLACFSNCDRAKTLGNKLRKWGPDFKKCDRRRPAQVLNRMKTNLAASKLIFRRKSMAGCINVESPKSSNKGPIPYPTSGLSLREYVYQESIFHELDILLKGCFDKGTKGRGWTIGSSSFITPQGSSCNSKAWFRLSAQCSGIALLGEADLYGQSLYLFGEVLRLSTIATQSCDLNMMIHFWAICKSLCHNRFPMGRQFILARAFVQHLRDQSLKSLGNHPLVRFLGSLMRVMGSYPENFHITMALAYWKTIHVLTNSCGIPQDHPIILRMASRCTKDWRSKFEARRELLDSYSNNLIQSLHASCTVKFEKKVGLLYEYIEATAKGKYNTKDIIEDQESLQNIVERAIQLWEQTKERCHERARTGDLTWQKYTQAFTFSTELLAKHHLGCLNEHGRSISLHQDRSKGFRYMNEAIDILRVGDLQCRIRAFSLSRRSALWLKAYQERSNAQEERFRRSEILKTIPRMELALPEPQQLGSRGGKGNARLAKNRAWWRRRQSMVRGTFESYVPKQ